MFSSIILNNVCTYMHISISVMCMHGCILLLMTESVPVPRDDNIQSLDTYKSSTKICHGLYIIHSWNTGEICKHTQIHTHLCKKGNKPKLLYVWNPQHSKSMTKNWKRYNNYESWYGCMWKEPSCSALKCYPSIFALVTKSLRTPRQKDDLVKSKISHMLYKFNQ